LIKEMALRQQNKSNRPLPHETYQEAGDTISERIDRRRKEERMVCNQSE